jgi:hypothetical protein
VILARIARDRGDALPEKLTTKRLSKYMRDWKMWEFGLLIGCNNTVVYSFAFFLPLVLNGALGYSLEKTFVLLFPPSVLGVFVSSPEGVPTMPLTLNAVDAAHRLAW